MAEEWRVSVIFAGPGARRYRHPVQVCRMMQGCLGDDVTVSAGERCVFLYAPTAAAAEEAEHAARQALIELGLTEDCRLERWDASSQEWQDVQSGLPAADTVNLRTTRLRAVAGKVATTVAGGLVENFLEGP